MFVVNRICLNLVTKSVKKRAKTEHRFSIEFHCKTKWLIDTTLLQSEAVINRKRKSMYSIYILSTATKPLVNHEDLRTMSCFLFFFITFECSWINYVMSYQFMAMRMQPLDFDNLLYL